MATEPPIGPSLQQPQRDKEARIAALQVAASSFAGPLPPPDLLRAYENLCPGSADRIISMAEAESRHRQGLENRTTDAQINGMKSEFAEARVGQFCAWSISIAFLVAGSLVAIKGQPWVGALFGGMGVSGIVANFIQGKKRQDEDGAAEPHQKPQDSNRKKRKR